MIAMPEVSGCRGRTPISHGPSWPHRAPRDLGKRLPADILLFGACLWGLGSQSAARLVLQSFGWPLAIARSGGPQSELSVFRIWLHESNMHLQLWRLARDSMIEFL